MNNSNKNKTDEICCPLCYNYNHEWKEVYSKNSSMLGKIDDIYIAWCTQESDYVLHNVKQAVLSN